MVTDRMFIIRYEKNHFFFYIKKIKYGTHDTEKKDKTIFFFATILTMQFRNFILRFC